MKIVIIAEDDDSTGELERARASFRGEGFGEPEVYPIRFPQRKNRMNLLQLLTLWGMCGRYNVPFREDDYRFIPEDATFTPGFVEGWIGGAEQRDLFNKGQQSTIYVGVAPDGRSHT